MSTRTTGRHAATSRRYNAFEAVNAMFDRAADRLNMPDWLRELIT